MGDPRVGVRRSVVRGGLGGLLLSAALPVFSVGAGSAAPAIEVAEGWTRPMPTVTTSSELYMVIHNRGRQPDRLVGARSSFCGMAELFEWHTSTQGALAMRPVPRAGIEVPPGGRLRLAPAGLHVMCMDRKGALVRGTRVPLTLTFERAGEIQVHITTREP